MYIQLTYAYIIIAIQNANQHGQTKCVADFDWFYYRGLHFRAYTAYGVDGHLRWKEAHCHLSLIQDVT